MKPDKAIPIEADWVDYLKAEKHFESYNGTCDCYYCKSVRPMGSRDSRSH